MEVTVAVFLEAVLGKGQPKTPFIIFKNADKKDVFKTGNIISEINYS